MSAAEEPVPASNRGPRLHLVVQAPAIETPDLKALAHLVGGHGITALRRAECEAFRIEDVVRTDGVCEFCDRVRLDHGFVPAAQTLDRLRLVAMDMDSTLITIECIDEIADVLGVKHEVATITERAMRGELDFRQSLRQRLALLEGVELAMLQRVYDERLELSPGAERLIATARRVGARTLLVSGGFTFFTDRLQARLGLDHVLANELEIQDGRLTGKLAGAVVDADAKAARVRELRAILAADGGLVAAIGDGANDLPMLAEADVSIAFRAKPVVQARTRYAIDRCGLDAALNLFT